MAVDSHPNSGCCCASLRGYNRSYSTGTRSPGVIWHYLSLIWVLFDLVILSVLISAVRYQGYKPEEEPS